MITFPLNEQVLYTHKGTTVLPGTGISFQQVTPQVLSPPCRFTTKFGMDWSGSSTAGAPGILKRGLTRPPHEECVARAGTTVCFGAANGAVCAIAASRGERVSCEPGLCISETQACMKLNGIVAIKVVKLYRSVSVPQLKPLLALHLASIKQLVLL